MVHQNRLARYCASSPFIYKAKKLGVGLIRSRASVSLNSARELYLQSFLIDNRSRNMSFTLGTCDVSALIKTLHDMIHYAVSLQVGGKGKKPVTGKQTRKRRHFDVSHGSEEGRRSSVRMILELLA